MLNLTTKSSPHTNTNSSLHSLHRLPIAGPENFELELSEHVDTFETAQSNSVRVRARSELSGRLQVGSLYVRGDEGLLA